MPAKKPIVLKFGGTSMGTPEAISSAMQIIRDRARRTPVVTVVSAMSGVTDQLLDIGSASLAGRSRKVSAQADALRARHEKVFLSLTGETGFRRWLEKFLSEQFGEILAIVDGIALLGEFSDRTRDRLVSYGEILSSSLLARTLQAVDRRFCHSDAREWLVADRSQQSALVNTRETDRRVRKLLEPLLRRGRLPVVPGFICRNSKGEGTTLGRNGSDYTASIVGAALRAREIWIYTDVDGVMTADPNLVAEAAILPQISYQEAAEMSYFGAKVLHPQTMIPAVEHRIPIRIKNTFNPKAPGTLIIDCGVPRPLVKTVTSVRNLSLVNLQGNGMVGVPGVSSRLFDVMAREQINVMMISQSSSEHSICMIILASDSARAVHAIRQEFALEIERRLIEGVDVTEDVAIISIIGEGMQGTPGVSGKFFEALGKHRINVLAIAQGSSELNISAAIRQADYRQAVQAIHTAFGLTRDLHVFLFGCGNIGRALLQQIHENQKHISRSLQVNLKVLGVSSSRHWRFSSSGLRPRDLEELAGGGALENLPESEPRPETEEIFRRISATYKSDIVLVDATGAELADTHIQGLRRGFHLVTANKKPLTNSLASYREIKRQQRKKGLQYQYEATFGAGLPLLYTLQDLIQTGDHIVRIQGCLSGTLGFICSKLDENIPFSEAVREAMKLGYTEPDPRDDLNGVDVARKALIIGREIGIPLELRDIRLEALLPQKYFRLRSVEDFLKNLPEADGPMRSLVARAHGEGKVLRFIAEIQRESCAVGLRRISRDSPIGRLSGPDNILVFQTQRYSNNPLVIQGPGAGASVTAGGVLSDILKIAKSI